MLLRALALSVSTVLLVAGCGDDSGSQVDPDQVDAIEPPDVGACRNLTPEDTDGKASNATRTVDCMEDHTAETFAVGPLPVEFDDADYDDPELGKYAFRTCSSNFERFLGADESLVMRTVVSWVWFQPSQKAWDKGARWYRCDVVGWGEYSKEPLLLPETARGLLLGNPDDEWMVCAEGPLEGSVKVPCSEPHTWRAVSTIKVGRDDEPYPGDRLVDVRSDQYCSDSVHAYLGYPVADYEYGYTRFHEAEWEAGNRRSVCWARTDS
jgi:hypothetical protein